MNRIYSLLPHPSLPIGPAVQPPVLQTDDQIHDLSEQSDISKDFGWQIGWFWSIEKCTWAEAHIIVFSGGQRKEAPPFFRNGSKSSLAHVPPHRIVTSFYQSGEKNQKESIGIKTLSKTFRKLSTARHLLLSPRWRVDRAKNRQTVSQGSKSSNDNC
jgi:hypothetical protein